MTEPLFREDAYLASCDATVTAVTPEGGIVLDRTVFYPTGGGQPGDGGVIRAGDRAIPVQTAVKGEAGAIVHIPAKAAPAPEIGETVVAEIDAARRDVYRRVHTCLHLLSVVIPLPVTGGQISDGKGRLDFDMPDAPEDKGAIEERLNALISRDLTVSEEWISDAELEANPNLVKTLRVKPPMGAGRVRLVRIGDGAETVDLQPCGGTHVRRTGEIGRVRIGKVEKKGKQNRRVYVHLEA